MEKGIIPDLQPEDESSHGLLNLFQMSDITPSNVLLPRSDIGLTILPEGLKSMGWEVKVIPVYKNALPANLQTLDLKNVDQIVFSSPSCVTNFLKLYGAFPENKEFIFRGKETEKRYLKLQNDFQTN
jgi:uroporphyrinogen III methyltransferase/synthase